MLPDLRPDFPLLARTVRGGKPLVYLDSGATSQRPQAVIDAMADYDVRHNAAVARGAHALSEEASELFESARLDVANFIGAGEREVVWTENATAALNLVANGFANASAGLGGAEASQFRLRAGDEIVVTQAEHHANFIPWQQLALKTGATLRWLPVDAAGRISFDDLDQVVTQRCKVLAFTHASNVTGVVTDVATLVARARAVGAFVVLDGCQSVPHLPIDVAELGVDFMAMSAHKMLGPTGIGALYGRAELLDALPPSIFGGGAIKTVSLEQTTWLDAPARFEAGSQPVTQAIGMAAGVGYLANLGMANVEAHERELAMRLRSGVAEIPGVTLLGPVGGDGADEVLGLASVVVDGVHAHDVGQVLDDAGIAVRVGHHCTQPLHRHFGAASSTRASAHVYTQMSDIEAFLESLAGVRAFFGVTKGAA